MEVLGGLASVAALIECTSVLISYTRACIHAKEERDGYIAKLNNILFLVQELENHSQASNNEDPWYRRLRKMGETCGTLTKEGKYTPPPGHTKETAGPMGKLYMTIAELYSELHAAQQSHSLRGKFKRLMNERLKWFWDRKKFEEKLAEITRNCGLVSMRLDLDHFEASKAAAISSRAAETSSRETAEGVTDIRIWMKTLDDKFIEQQKKEKEEEDEREKETMMKWLSPTLDFLARQKDLHDSCFRSAGQWLLDHDVFRRWTHGQYWYLRCFGEPGAGKTMLSSILVNHLQKQSELNSRIRVICLYLNHNNSKIQTSEALLGSLLKQLIQLECSSQTFSDLRAEYDKVKRRGQRLARPGATTIKKYLKMELSAYNQVYLVVDALDECKFPEKLLQDIRDLRGRNLSLLVTSRQEGEKPKEIHCNSCSAKNLKIYYTCKLCNGGNFDICQLCRDNGLTCRDASHPELSKPDRVDLNIVTPEDELRRYVTEELNKEIGYGLERWDRRLYSSRPDSTTFGRKALKDPKLLEEIPKRIAEKAAGKYLYAKLYLDSVKTKETVRAIYETLNTFPERLEDLYEENMLRVQSGPFHALGLKVLSRVIYASRLLSLSELKHLVAIIPERTELYDDDDDDVDQENILSSTQGLISIDGAAKIVRPVHLTLVDYFSNEHVRKKWFPNAHKDFAEACLSYLNYRTFSKPVPEEDDYDAKVKKYPFVAYASQYWGDHVRYAGSDSDSRLYDAAARLINDSHRIEAYIQAAWATGRPPHGWDFRKGVSALHVCAWYGLSWIIKGMKDEDIDIDIEEHTYSQTPLMYACRAGHLEVARELLSRGANVNKISRKDRTALYEAVEWDNEDIVELLLLQDNLDVNAVNAKESNRTTLTLAADLRHVNILDRLLGHPSIDANHQDKDGHTALSLASAKGHEQIVSSLLEKAQVVDIDLVDHIEGMSSLIRAAQKGHCGILKLLLDKGANPMLKDRLGGGTAMLRAADYGYVSALEILLQNQENLLCLDDDDRTLLHGACANGKSDAVEFLNEKGLNRDARDKNGLTALHEASRMGHVAVVKILIKLGADSTVVDNFGRTARIIAWQHGNVDIMKILEINDATTDTTNSNLMPKLDEAKLPVWSMAKLGLLAPLEQVVMTRKSELSETEPGSNYTSLHWAILADQIDILKILIEKGNMSLEKANRYGRTPLHFAVICNNIPAISVLLSHGAIVDAEDQWGIRPLVLAQVHHWFAAGVALIEGGAKVDRAKISIESMFFEAVRLGKVDVVEKLLKNGVDKWSRDVEGMTAMQLAKEADNPDMIRALTFCG